MDIANVANQMIPITYFRRNAGDVLNRLSQTKQLFITKDGIIRAIISDVSIPSNSKTGILSTAGVWKNRKDLKKMKRQNSRYGQIFS